MSDMKLHLAERDPQHHAWPKRGVDAHRLRLRILLSYHYYKDIDLDALFAKYFTKPYPDVFADSGAFSAESQGVHIDIHEYADWIKRWKHLFSTYANLDVIGDAEATEQNQRILEGMGLSPLPVFHVGSDWRYLEDLVNRYAYIALGGMVPHMRYEKRIMPWIVRAFKIGGERAVFHGFGATSWAVVSNLPWYSVDSSSWGQGFRYGQVPLFDLRQGRFFTADLGNYDHWRKHASLVREMGFDPMDFADRARNDRAKICAISALSYMLAEQWLRNRHGEVYIPQRDNAGAGPRLHLVAGASNPDAPKGGNMSVTALAQAGLGASGDRLHLSDTSSGINFGDADRGVKLHLADARGHSGGDLAAAEWGLRTYLTDSYYTQLRPVAAAGQGIKVFLAEHSLDRGG